MSVQYEFELSNPKYHFGVSDSFSVIENNDYRVIQLPTLAKLTTDNQSIVSDFPIKENAIGASPYVKYIIRVKDADGAELNIAVHQYAGYALLCPVLMGFQTGSVSDVVALTENWRVRELIRTHDNFTATSPVAEMIGPKNLTVDSRKLRDPYLSIILVDKSEFGAPANVLKVSTLGVFDGRLSVLSRQYSVSIFDIWRQSEQQSGTGNLRAATAPSSAALILQIFLHTLSMWYDACQNRKAKIHYSNTISNHLEKNVVEQISTYTPAKKHIINIGHDISIWIPSEKPLETSRWYHVKETTRCGHFRHLKNGKIVYIPPTVVHYKKVFPNQGNANARPIIYRNTEDFLREKSYLEDEIYRKLQTHGIAFEREKTFPWMGKKRLDFFLPEYGVAIECQGVQHFYKYGANDHELEVRKTRDKAKYSECKKNGVQLFYYMNEDIELPVGIEHKSLYFTNTDELFKAMNLLEQKEQKS